MTRPVRLATTVMSPMFRRSVSASCLRRSGRAWARMSSISPCSGPPEGVSLNIAVSLGHDRWLVGFKGELHAVASPDGFGKAEGVAFKIRVDFLDHQHGLS